MVEIEISKKNERANGPVAHPAIFHAEWPGAFKVIVGQI